MEGGDGEFGQGHITALQDRSFAEGKQPCQLKALVTGNWTGVMAGVNDSYDYWL